jgi:GMP synthase-like glutamine amidotransferase
MFTILGRIIRWTIEEEKMLNQVSILLIINGSLYSIAGIYPWFGEYLRTMYDVMTIVGICLGLFLQFKCPYIEAEVEVLDEYQF